MTLSILIVDDDSHSLGGNYVTCAPLATETQLGNKHS